MATEYGMDWELKFGEKWAKMTPDERNMAIYMAINESFTYMRAQEKRYSELPCQDCNQDKSIRLESLKGKFWLYVTLISSGSSIAVAIITALVTLAVSAPH